MLNAIRRNKYSVPVLVLLFVTFVGTGIWGRDFGRHWDEPSLLSSVRETVRTGVFLPRSYNYPSMSYLLTLSSVTPTVVAHFMPRSGSERPTLTQALLSLIDSKDFVLRARTVFILVSSLTILWVFLAGQALWGSYREACVGAAVMGLSWEYAYHARWVAPDAVMAQFGALSMLLLILSLVSSRRAHEGRARGWLILSAGAAGLACATKYPAGLLLVPVLIQSVVLFPPWRRGKDWLKVVAGLGTAFLLAYVVVSPGSVLEPYRSIADIRWVMLDYRTGHGGHTVRPGLDHLSRMATYLSLAGFSAYWPIALYVSVLSATGAVVLMTSVPGAWVLVVFPVLYTLLLSTQQVMIVRNLLVLLPFTALFAGRGFFVVWDRSRNLGHPLARKAAAGAALLVLLSGFGLNLQWLIRAADSIANPRPAEAYQKADAFIKSHPDTMIWVSERLRQSLPRETVAGGRAPNVTTVAEGARLVAFVSSEADHRYWPANTFAFTEAWFGSGEVNFDYYPGWIGPEKVVFLTLERARNLPPLFRDNLEWRIQGVGDFDRDGNADILWRDASTGKMTMWLMKGARVHARGTPATVSDLDWKIQGVGDFDRDGNADIVWRHAVTGQLAIWLMNGTTARTLGYPGTMADPAWQIHGIGDFDGDGKADILWRHTSGFVAVWLMNGTSLGASGTPGSAGPDWTVAGVGDVNGDGKADVLWRQATGQVSVWLMNGTRLDSSRSVPGPPGADWRIAGIGDFNRDGKAGILWRHASGTISVWSMHGTSLGGTSAPGSAGADWTIAGMSDFDGDGRTDILWRQPSGPVTVWLMNGVRVSGSGVAGRAQDNWAID